VLGTAGSTSFGTSPFPNSIAVDDFNGDGQPDLAVSHLTPGVVSVLSNLTGTWTDLGSGLAGVDGVPQLRGNGPLSQDTSGSFALGYAAPAAPALLFLSVSSSPAPFKCGQLVPVPPILQLPLATNGVGASALAWSSFPAGVSGISVWAQWAVLDAAAPCGVALSNALRADVP
jgi:FG-GAP repeat